jgi:hypothetical protein
MNFKQDTTLDILYNNNYQKNGRIKRIHDA